MTIKIRGFGVKMKKFILVLSSLAFTQASFAGEASKNLALSCLAQDSQLVQKTQPMELERLIKNLAFKSEIYYQIVLNRVSLVAENLESLNDYKKFDVEISNIRDQQNAIQKQKNEALELAIPDFSKLRIMFDGNEEEKKALAEYDKDTPEEDRLQIELEKVLDQRLNFDKDLIKNPRLGEYVKELESKLSSTDSNFRAQKSYGDHLINIVNKAQSCDQAHSQYRKLAIEAKTKRNFKIETISSLHTIDLNKAHETEVTREIRKMLSESGYRKAAETYTFSKNSPPAYVLANEAMYVALDSITSGKSSEVMDLNLGSKSQTAQQIEATLEVQIKKGLSNRHSDMTKAVSLVF